MLAQKVTLIIVALRMGIGTQGRAAAEQACDNCFLVCSLPPGIYHLGVLEVFVVCLAALGGIISQGLSVVPWTPEIHVSQSFRKEILVKNHLLWIIQ